MVVIRVVAALALLFTIAACSVGTEDVAPPESTTTSATPTGEAPTSTPTDSDGCPAVVDSGSLGRIQNPELTETSGLATSELNPEVIWAHNDSGGDPAVYAVGRDGSDLGKYTLEGTTNRDWEDMARWTDPATGDSWLYVGDIGDNVGQWESILVHRVREPRVGAPPGETSPSLLTGVETFEFTYPDGPHDAETLLVDPATGEISIVTKADGTAAQVFAGPGTTPGLPVELTEVGRLDLSSRLAGVATAGDRIDGFVLIRTYLEVLGYTTDDGPWWEAAPCEFDPPFEIQGEAIAGEPDGRGYITVSEGRATRINRSLLG